MLEFTYSSLSNKRVGFNKTVLDRNFYKNINVLPFYRKHFPVLILQKKFINRQALISCLGRSNFFSNAKCPTLLSESQQYLFYNGLFTWFFAKFLRNFYEIFTKFLRNFYKFFAKLLQTDFSRGFLQNFCKIFTKFLRKFYKFFAKLLQIVKISQKFCEKPREKSVCNNFAKNL